MTRKLPHPVPLVNKVKIVFQQGKKNLNLMRKGGNNIFCFCSFVVRNSVSSGVYPAIGHSGKNGEPVIICRYPASAGMSYAQHE